MNILFSSVGKRVELVNTFHSATKNISIKAKLYGVDMNPEMCPARFVLEDCFKVSAVTSDSFIDEIIRICIDHDISLIIPTIDTELLIYSKNRLKFKEQNINVVLSDHSLIAACRDKRLSNSIFSSIGINVPEHRSIKSPQFPIFAKPYDGSLSKDLFVIHDENDITDEILENEKLIFMELVDVSKYREYTVDAYYDKDGQLVSVVPRERLLVRSGEMNQGRTDKGEIYTRLKGKLSKIKGARGCLTAQFFFDKNTGDLKGIEINPRFGGGYPLTYQSGAKYSDFILLEYLKEQELEPFEEWSDNFKMLRYDAAFFF